MSMGGGKGGGGKGGKGKDSTPDTRLLSGLASRYEQEARSSREGSLNQLAGIFNYGADWLGPSMGGPSNSPGGPFASGGSTEPRKYSRADILDTYSKYDVGKGQDVERILGGLQDTFTLEELKSGANLSGLSGRSAQAWTSSVGELERLAKSGGSGFGGMSGGPGGYGASLLPIAQTAIERSKQATSNAVQGLTDRSASMKGGGADNPFFQRMIAQTKILGDQQTSQIPSRIVEQYMSNVLPLAFGQSPVSTNALGSAGGINASLINSAMGAGAAAGSSSTDAIMSAIGSIASAIGSYYAMGAIAAT